MPVALLRHGGSWATVLTVTLQFPTSGLGVGDLPKSTRRTPVTCRVCERESPGNTSLATVFDLQALTGRWPRELDDWICPVWVQRIELQLKANGSVPGRRAHPGERRPSARLRTEQCPEVTKGKTLRVIMRGARRSAALRLDRPSR
jgi:hypothetical protein